MRARLLETFTARRPFAKGSRIPSMAEEVLAEIHKPASAAAGERRKALYLVSFTSVILRPS